jgi:hypothetical protein
MRLPDSSLITSLDTGFVGRHGANGRSHSGPESAPTGALPHLETPTSSPVLSDKIGMIGDLATAAGL